MKNKKTKHFILVEGKGFIYKYYSWKNKFVTFCVKFQT